MNSGSLLHRHNRVFPVSMLVCVLLPLGCAGPRPVDFDIPFQYPSAGMGGSGVANEIVLEPETEVATISSALFSTLQGMEYSIMEPDLDPGELLPQLQLIRTDAVEVTKTLREEHNAMNTDMEMPGDRLYRLHYEIKYSVVRRKFRFKAWAILEQRGAAGEWRPFTGDYSGRFFVALVHSELDKVLRESQPEFRNHEIQNRPC